MLEGTLVALLMTSVFATIIFMGQCLNAKLDAAYRSRFIAFSSAMHGCNDGEAAPPMDPQDKPANDPEASRVTSNMENKLQLSAALMNISHGSAEVTSNRQSFSSQSWVGCVEANYGANSSLPGDSSAIQNQVEAIFPYLWGLIQPMFDFGL